MRQFLINEKGERTAVVLPIGEYEELMERLEDAEALREADEVLAAIERGEEEAIPGRASANLAIHSSACACREGGSMDAVRYRFMSPATIDSRSYESADRAYCAPESLCALVTLTRI